MGAFGPGPGATALRDGRQIPQCRETARALHELRPSQRQYLQYPGLRLPPCDDIQEFLDVVAILDPDFWIKNHGNLASNPGTLTVQLHDLRGSGLVTTVIPVPAIAAGADTFVTIQTNGLLFKASEGVTLTLDYTDSAGTRHNVRKVTKCPDN